MDADGDGRGDRRRSSTEKLAARVFAEADYDHDLMLTFDELLGSRTNSLKMLCGPQSRDGDCQRGEGRGERRGGCRRDRPPRPPVAAPAPRARGRRLCPTGMRSTCSKESGGAAAPAPRRRACSPSRRVPWRLLLRLLEGTPDSRTPVKPRRRHRRSSPSAWHSSAAETCAVVLAPRTAQACEETRTATRPGDVAWRTAPARVPQRQRHAFAARATFKPFYHRIVASTPGLGVRRLEGPCARSRSCA